MKLSKKLTALFLTLCLVLFSAVLPGFAGEEPTGFADGEKSLVIFITGLGQSNAYLFDESYTKEGAFPHGTLQDYENYAPLIAEHKYITKWNLLATNANEAFEDKSVVKHLLSAVSDLLFSAFLRKNLVKDEDIRPVVRGLFRSNLLDGQGGWVDNRVVVPVYNVPVSEYPYGEVDGVYTSEARNRFFGSVPVEKVLREKMGDDFEDYLYCFNTVPFYYTSKKVVELHSFIETALRENKVGADKVVLVPMSMGASLVSAYLNEYPKVEDNHVRRVVSIVGCWDGTDVFSDLAMKNYADNFDELAYHGVVTELVGEPWGHLVSAMLHLFPHDVLVGTLNKILDGVVQEIILQSPAFMYLIPSDRYDEIRPFIPNDAARREADAYRDMQRTLNDRMTALEAQGVTFSFVSGYGLAFGEATPAYHIFGAAKSSATTNADEMVNISSTSPGTSYVKPGTTFADTEGRILSPDGSIDISTAPRRGSSWYFYRQKHELQYNNTAIRLAIDLARGRIKTVEDCDNLAEDGVYYPQFNEMRDIKLLEREYIPMFDFHLGTGFTPSAEQQALYDRAKAMLASTQNDMEGDKAVSDEFRDMLVDIGVLKLPAPPSQLERITTAIFKSYNDTLYKIYGGRGYTDVLGS